MSPAAGLRLERLDSHHDLSEFDSGNNELDGWLKRHALAAQQMDSTRTFVLTYQNRVVGFFSLTMGSVLRQDAPARLVRGLPAYPVGMVLLAARGRPQRARQRAGRHTARRSAPQGVRRRRGRGSSPRRRGRHRRERHAVL